MRELDIMKSDSYSVGVDTPFQEFGRPATEPLSVRLALLVIASASLFLWALIAALIAITLVVAR